MNSYSNGPQIITTINKTTEYIKELKTAAI